MKRSAIIAALSLLMTSMTVTHAQRGELSGSVTANPLFVVLESVPTPQEAGTGVRLSGSVRNLSTVRASDISLTLHVEPVTLGAQGGFSQAMQQVQSMRESGFGWRVCSNTPGDYVVVVTAHWTDSEGSFAAESNAVLVTVIEGRRPCPNSFEFQTSA